MATGLVALGSAVAPSIIQLIAGLVHPAAKAAEALGPKTGPVKLATVFGSVMTDLQNAAAAGAIPKDLPPDPTVQLIIQSVVSSMNLAGMLSGAPAAPSAQAIVLKSGQTATVSAA